MAANTDGTLARRVIQIAHYTVRIARTVRDLRINRYTSWPSPPRPHSASLSTDVVSYRIVFPAFIAMNRITATTQLENRAA